MRIFIYKILKWASSVKHCWLSLKKHIHSPPFIQKIGLLGFATQTQVVLKFGCRFLARKRKWDPMHL